MPRSESGRTVPRSHARHRVVGRGLCRLAVNSGVPPVLKHVFHHLSLHPQPFECHLPLFPQPLRHRL